jgi:hypothetical protein
MFTPWESIKVAPNVVFHLQELIKIFMNFMDSTIGQSAKNFKYQRGVPYVQIHNHSPVCGELTPPG